MHLGHKHSTELYDFPNFCSTLGRRATDWPGLSFRPGCFLSALPKHALSWETKIGLQIACYGKSILGITVFSLPSGWGWLTPTLLFLPVARKGAAYLFFFFCSGMHNMYKAFDINLHPLRTFFQIYLAWLTQGWGDWQFIFCTII